MNLEPQNAPAWLRPAVESADADATDALSLARAMRRAMTVLKEPRQAAVLVLFSGSAADGEPALPGDADVLLTQRASTMRQHRGQVAFPGGAVDPGDQGPVDTALREACEETGVRREDVTPLAVMPKLFVPPSRFDVTPVLGYWRNPAEVRVVNTGETERVVRVPLSELLDPANRFMVHRTGYRSPAFQVDGMLVWGLTGGILNGIFKNAGWELDWDQNDVRDLEEALAALGMTL